MKKTLQLLALAGSLLVPSAQAQTYTIDWYSIDGGGGTSSGGNFTLTGTIGQPDAGTAAGGNYTLTGGFMSVVTVIQTPGGPLLKVTRQGNSVIISWPDPSTDFVLQETDALATPSVNTSWGNNLGAITISGGEKRVTIAAPVNYKYFRLHKPTP